MRYKNLLAAGVAVTAIAAMPAFAQDAGKSPNVAVVAAADDQTGSAPAATAGQDDPNDIIITARQRSESLKNVPIAVTALTGDELKDRQVNTVKDIAALSRVASPGDSGGSAPDSHRLPLTTDPERP